MWLSSPLEVLQWPWSVSAFPWVGVCLLAGGGTRQLAQPAFQLSTAGRGFSHWPFAGRPIDGAMMGRLALFAHIWSHNSGLFGSHFAAFGDVGRTFLPSGGRVLGGRHLPRPFVGVTSAWVRLGMVERT